MISKHWIALCPLIVWGASVASAQQNPTGQWGQETGAYFYYGATATNGTYIYLFGGIQSGAGNPSGDAYRVCRRYDPASNVYTTLADMPTQCYLNSGVYYVQNNVAYLYSFGNGYYGNGAVYRYDIAANSWTQVGNLLSPRYGTAACVIGSMFYIAGGYYGGYTAVVEDYNPANNTSTARASMPAGTYMPGMAYVPAVDKAYVIGGYNNAYLTTNYEFTPPTAAVPNGSWAARAAIADQNGQPAQRGYLPAVFTLANRVYVCGGYSNAGPTLTCLEYLPTTNTWAQRANMTYQRYYTSGTPLNGKGYVFGGGSYPTTAEEFTPPAFGSAPNIPAAVVQIGSVAASSAQAQGDPSSPDGWTNGQMQFSADVTDPDSGQQVRLRVQVKPASASWTSNQVVSLQTPLAAQGVHTLTYAIPADNGYDWRWRVEDAFANSYPAVATAWVDAFGTEAAPNTNSPDFRSDQIPPADPVALAPHNTDIQVGDPTMGDVSLYWTESTDNGPVTGISYEIQVAIDGGFNIVEAQLFSTAGTSSYPVALSVSRFDKFWRIRARDVGGNLSNWSAPLNFRVTYNDGEDHGGGDSAKTCGFAAAGTAAPLSALIGILVVGAAMLRRKLS